MDAEFTAILGKAVKGYQMLSILRVTGSKSHENMLVGFLIENDSISSIFFLQLVSSKYPRFLTCVCKENTNWFAPDLSGMSKYG